MSGIPTTGAVTMTALNTNFSGGNSLSGYRNKTIYNSSTNAATTIPGSGPISFSTFRGKRALAPPFSTPTANTPTFSSLPYTQLANGAPFPTAGTSFSLLNIGPSEWYNLMIRYVLNGNFIYFTSPQTTAGQDVNILASATYNVFTMPAGNITALTIRATNLSPNRSTEINYTNTSGTITNTSISNRNATTGGSSAITVLDVRIGGPIMTYTWSGTNSPTSYTVNLYASGNQTPLATLTNTTATSATYAPVGGTTYFTTVTATNAGGTSGLVTSGSVAYNPPVVTVNTPTITLGSILVCEWSATNSPTSYTVEKYTTGFSNPDDTITTTATTASFRLLSGYTATFRVRATNSQGTSDAVPSAFSPQASSAFRIWFDASYSASVTGTSTVTAWSSQGSGSITATNHTGSASYVTDSQSGRNIIKFGPGIEMRFTVALPNQARAWFIVAKNTTQLVSSGLGQYWALINQTAGNGQDSLGGPSYAGGYYDMGEGPSGIRVNINGSTNTNPYNVWKCYTWINSATAANNFIGVNKASITLTTSIAASSYRTDSVAYSINTALYGTGSDVAEIICYNSEITSTERDIIIDYLIAKWKIT